jgi:hypothetical protein
MSGQPARPAQPTKKIYIFEERSCHQPGDDQLIERLRRWYKSSAEVRHYDLAAPDELVPLPPELFFRLQESETTCLPALVVNGAVVATGRLPKFNRAVELIEASLARSAYRSPTPSSSGRS